MRFRQCNEKNCNDTVEKSSLILTMIFMSIPLVVFVILVSKIELAKIMRDGWTSMVFV